MITPPMGPEAACYRVLQTCQIAESSHVCEIYLGSLDKPFPYIGEIWPENNHLIRSFERRDPCLYSVQSHPKVFREIGQVTKLAGPRRQSPQEDLELREISHLADGSHVPFEVGLYVACMPQAYVTVGV